MLFPPFGGAGFEPAQRRGAFTDVTDIFTTALPRRVAAPRQTEK
jgi:hypothetical protein